MVLDDPLSLNWIDRLRKRSDGKNREYMEDCFYRVEEANIALGNKSLERVYIGGVLNDVLWFSYGIDESERLMPRIQRFHVSLITDYQRVI